MIVINNLFGIEASRILLLFKVEKQYWHILKSFMVFLNMLQKHELEDIEEDKKITEVLEKL